MLIKKGGKRAQITVFIIVGLIILFGVGTVLYMRQTSAGPAKFLQTKTPPVEQYVLTCLERTAEDAIRMMGTQGGFVEVPDEIALNPTRHVSLVPGVPSDLAPKVPYWYWDGQTEVPSLRYMEKEVEWYIDQNLDTCINNFSGFEDEYIITPKSNFKSSVVFADKDTVVGLDWLLEIQPRGSDEVTKKEDFMINLDVKVKRMYELARKLLEAENEKQFFETMTINLMASFPPKDIPFDGMEFTCAQKVWHLSQIKDKLITALEPAVMGIRFRNTDHPPFLEDEDAYLKVQQAVKDYKESETFVPLRVPAKIPEDAYEYFQYYFNFTDDDYTDLKVTANYRKDWGMNMLSTPSQYGIMKSGVQDLKSKILSFLCLNLYHFVYDVVYPVTISINDPKAFRGRSFVFRYAFPVQIYHNKGDRSLQPTTEFNPAEFDLDFCDFYSQDTHTIRVLDTITNAELSHVNLTYRCFSEACELGETRTNNQHLQWEGAFPSGCANAVITAKRKGYLDEEVQFAGQDILEIRMHPVQTVNFTVRKNRDDSIDVSRFLQPDENVVISIEHRNPDMSQFFTFGSEDTFQNKQVMQLLQEDAKYDVNMMLFKQLTPEKDIMIGGWLGEWDVKYSDVADANKVIFHLFQKVPPPQTDQDFVDMYELMSNHSLHPDVKHEILRVDSPAPVPVVDETASADTTGVTGATGATSTTGSAGEAGVAG